MRTNFVLFYITFDFEIKNDMFLFAGRYNIEAATVNFTDTLKKATLINVRGTREVLNLGEACSNLKLEQFFL